MNHGKRIRNVMGTMNHEKRFIRECEKLSGLSRTTRWRLEQKGEFPNFIHDVFILYPNWQVPHDASFS